MDKLPQYCRLHAEYISTVDVLGRRDGGMTAVSVSWDDERANSAGVQPRSLNSRDEEPESLSDLAVHPNSDNSPRVPTGTDGKCQEQLGGTQAR